MAISELADNVRARVCAYVEKDYLYYGARAIVVAHCLEWNLGAAGPRAVFRFDRLVTGNEWHHPEWEFFVAWEEVSSHDLSAGRLRCANLTDCVFLDSSFLAAAEKIGPDCDDATIRAFKDKVFGFDCQQ